MYSNAKAFLHGADRVLSAMDAKPGKVAPFMQAMVEESATAQFKLETSLMSAVFAIAAQIEGEIGANDLPDGGIEVTKGGHVIATYHHELSDGSDPLVFNILASVKLSPIGAAVYELTCDHHRATAKEYLDTAGVRLTDAARFHETSGSTSAEAN